MPASRQLATPFGRSLEAHLRRWRAGIDGSRDREWPHWSDGIHPAYRALAEDVVRADSVKLHRHAAHLRSSQMFAFNLFLPFRDEGRERLSDRVGGMIGAPFRIDEVRFEWVPPGALLGEIRGDRPVGDEPATGVDIVLWGQLTGGERAVVLLEVKLSEGEFTSCGGRNSAANQRKDVCASATRFFGEPSACYLRRPKRARRDRRYWEIFAASHGSVHDAFPGADMTGPCPFAESMQQPMRNLAIARGLEQDPTSAVEQAWFGLCAHDDNPDIAAHWERWRSLLPDEAMAPALPASEVVRTGEEEGFVEWAAWMRDRYRL